MGAVAAYTYRIEGVILTGYIRERQRDRQPDEWKYLVNGQALGGAVVTVVVKFGATDKLVIITVFRE